MKTKSIPISSKEPIGKVAGAAIAGAAVVVLAYIIKLIFGVELPAEVTGSLTVLFSFLAGYFIPLKLDEIS